MIRTKTPRLLFILLIVASVGGATWLLTRNSEKAITPPTEAAEHGAEHDETPRTKIAEDSAKAMGIEAAPASAAVIRETKTLSGRIVLNQNTSAQVKARFAGVVRGVFKQVGESVKKGEKLATVESNESLQTYIVPSPLDGIVLERNISVGDEANEAPIFVVANLDKLWVEFFVFANDLSQINKGQKVTIATLDNKLTAESTIQAILPTADSQSQTVSARAIVENSSGIWRSGMTVRVDVTLSEKQVPLAVPTAAIQAMEGKSVVFVKQGEEYVTTPVTLGAADHTYTEITAGLSEESEIVIKNSFVVKADIGKASAAHED